MQNFKQNKRLEFINKAKQMKKQQLKETLEIKPKDKKEDK